MSELLTVRVIAKRLDVTTETVRTWIASGKLEHSGRTPGGHYRVSEAQLARLLEGAPAPAQGEAEREEDIKAMLVAARLARGRARKQWSA
jgi:excisionase family DNA binding protein